MTDYDGRIMNVRPDKMRVMDYRTGHRDARHAAAKIAAEADADIYRLCLVLRELRHAIVVEIGTVDGLSVRLESAILDAETALEHFDVPADQGGEETP